MNISQNHLTFSASLITGPTHNRLSVRFGEQVVATPSYTDLLITAVSLPPTGLVRAVEEVDKAQCCFPKNYHINEILYRSDDTNSFSHYSRLLNLILEYATDALSTRY